MYGWCTGGMDVSDFMNRWVWPLLSVCNTWVGGLVCVGVGVGEWVGCFWQATAVLGVGRGHERGGVCVWVCASVV